MAIESSFMATTLSFGDLYSTMWARMRSFYVSLIAWFLRCERRKPFRPEISSIRAKSSIVTYFEKGFGFGFKPSKMLGPLSFKSIIRSSSRSLCNSKCSMMRLCVSRFRLSKCPQ